ncbi:hypothetical protein [Roseomonas harenae]|uniref:hypothetical protein n=1 Tax=Muricoccus harenae TaxID=2692566 RepID=UPI001331B94C|nr:hypothetical protein [Roseomonas harenae]
MTESEPDCGAMRLAFRMALLDAAGADGSVTERCARLEAARGLLAAALAAGGAPGSFRVSFRGSAVPEAGGDAGRPASLNPTSLNPTSLDPASPSPVSLSMVRDRATMATALQGGYEEAWAEVSGGR